MMQTQRAPRTFSKLALETVQWTTLTHIDDVSPLGDKDYAVLEELREVIAKHGYENRFGICLLHKHFDLKAGEIALEETDELARVSTIKAAQDDGGQNTIETMWRFGRESGLGPLVKKCVLRCHYFLGHKQRHKIEGH